MNLLHVCMLPSEGFILYNCFEFFVFLVVKKLGQTLYFLSYITIYKNFEHKITIGINDSDPA